MLKKKIWPNFQRIVEVFTQKIFNMLSNIWVWDPRSGIRKKPIPDPGSRGQKGTGSGSGSATLLAKVKKGLLYLMELSLLVQVS
jgi:hypothetical protein